MLYVSATRLSERNRQEHAGIRQDALFWTEINDVGFLFEVGGLLAPYATMSGGFRGRSRCGRNKDENHTTVTTCEI